MHEGEVRDGRRRPEHESVTDHRVRRELGPAGRAHPFSRGRALPAG